MAIKVNDCIYGWTAAEFKIIVQRFNDCTNQESFVSEMFEDYPSLTDNRDEFDFTRIWNTLLLFSGEDGTVKVNEVEY